MTPYGREEQKLKIARTGQLYCLSVRYLEVNIKQYNTTIQQYNNTSNDFNTVEIYCVAKGYHECTFQVEIGERFVAMQKNSTKGRAFKIWNDRGQLGHLERELVEPLWSFERLQW